MGEKPLACLGVEGSPSGGRCSTLSWAALRGLGLKLREALNHFPAVSFFPDHLSKCLLLYATADPGNRCPNDLLLLFTEFDAACCLELAPSAAEGAMS